MKILIVETITTIVVFYCCWKGSISIEAFIVGMFVSGFLIGVMTIDLKKLFK